jgi:hypothetical protein
MWDPMWDQYTKAPLKIMTIIDGLIIIVFPELFVLLIPNTANCCVVDTTYYC